jgi:predicted ribosome quality control (RQC) complex YloA/Tae2 family protein
MVKTNIGPRNQRLRLIEYTLPQRWTVLVGRTDTDNDYLSLTMARPDDWWFHVRGVPGSHVILRGPPG